MKANETQLAVVSTDNQPCVKKGNQKKLSNSK